PRPSRIRANAVYSDGFSKPVRRVTHTDFAILDPSKRPPHHEFSAPRLSLEDGKCEFVHLGNGPRFHRPSITLTATRSASNFSGKRWYLRFATRRDAMRSTQILSARQRGQSV